MKVLFLDIDGVLNSKRSAIAYGGYPLPTPKISYDRFDDIAVRLIRKLCDDFDIKIVLSSSWRICDEDDFKKLIEVLDLPVIGRTPILYGCERGVEIDAWLHSQKESIECYAIVDDVDEMLKHQIKRFVKCNCEEGLTFVDYTKLQKIFIEGR